MTTERADVSCCDHNIIEIDFDWIVSTVLLRQAVIVCLQREKCDSQMPNPTKTHRFISDSQLSVDPEFFDAVVVSITSFSINGVEFHVPLDAVPGFRLD